MNIDEDKRVIEDAIAKYRDVFSRHGFGDYMIDFSDTTAEAIEAMANALLRLEESTKKEDETP